MRRKTNCIFLLIFLNLMLFSVEGCDFAPALIQPSEESTFIEERTEETSEYISIKKDDEKETTQESTTIYVHVCGQVKNPGLYELSVGSRADAAVKAAGGMKKDADEKQVNLAQVLQDGMQIYIPSKEDGAGGNETFVGTTEYSMEASAVTGSQLNINTASADELKTLSGIGESKANAIVEYREINGLFSTIEDIKNVSGIGDGIYEKIKNDITV